MRETNATEEDKGVSMLFRALVGLSFVALAVSSQTQASACDMARAEGAVKNAQAKIEHAKLIAEQCAMDQKANSNCKSKTSPAFLKSTAERELKKAEDALAKETKKCEVARANCNKEIEVAQRQLDSAVQGLKRAEDIKAQCAANPNANSNCKSRTSPDFLISQAKMKIQLDQAKLDGVKAKCAALQ